MASRTLEITLISARDLKDVNLISRMEVYAVVSLSGDPRFKQRTPPDREGGRNPTWNSTFRFTIPAGDPDSLSLHILLRTDRAFGDRDVGEVHVPLKELFAGAGAGASAIAGSSVPIQFVSYQIRKPSSRKAQGVLNLSYKISAAAVATSAAYPPPMAAPYPPLTKPPKADEPVMAYPAGYPRPAASTAHPPYAPPPKPYGYAVPPAAARYGYAPAGYGYGAPPPVVQPARKNKFGMGMAAGLLGGALGGLLIGDVVSDASAYDAGYDDGLDDAGGFDF